MICSRCQTENPAEAGFCRNCGAPLAAASPAAPVPPAVVQPVYTPAAAPAGAKNPGRWPIAAGLLVLLGLLGSLAGLALEGAAYVGYRMPWAMVFSAVLDPLSILILIMTLLSAVLFLAPTRKVPVLSSLPRLLLAFGYPLLFFLDFFLYKRSLTMTAILSLAISFVLPVLAILYFIGTLIRPKSAVLPGIHLGVTIFYALFALIGLAVSLLTANSFLLLFSSFFMRTADLFFAAGFAVAAFALRR